MFTPAHRRASGTAPQMKWGTQARVTLDATMTAASAARADWKPTA
jgi:hypothetical protein